MLSIQSGKLVRPIPSGFFDKFGLSHLTDLEKILEIIGEDGTEVINVKAFTTAVKILLKDDVTSKEIKLLFHKIDAYSFGAVPWSSLMCYLLQLCNEREVQERTCNFRPFAKISGRFPCLDHHDSTMAMQISPEHDGSVDMCNGNYISISRNGYLITRNPDLEIVSKHLIEKYPSKDRPTIAVTDIVCLGEMDMVAVSTSCWDVRFYNSSPADFQMDFSIVEFPKCIMTLAYHVKPLNMSSDSLLICGDDGGGVVLIWTNPRFFSNLQMSIALKQKLSKIQYIHISKNLIGDVKLQHLQEVHPETVLKVKYVPCINCFISCAPSTREAVVTYDLLTQSKTSFRSLRGVVSFDFNESTDWIIAGCMDNSIKIWNRFVTQKPTKILNGHVSPVEFIVIDQSRMIMMSFCRLKYLKVWNFIKGISLQTINCGNIGLGLHAVTCIMYNPFTRILLLHTHQMIAFQAGGDDDEASEEFFHRHPIIGVMYSDKFDTVITGDSSSLVIVWNLNTGQQAYRFPSFQKITGDGFEKPIEMTAMNLDYSQRRLITADSIGRVKIWNYNSGIKLKTFVIEDIESISAIANFKNHFYTAGTQINFLFDDGEVSYQKTWSNAHKEKIVGVAIYRDSIIVSISITGELMIWIKELGIPLRRLTDNGSNYNEYSIVYLKTIKEAKEKEERERLEVNEARKSGEVDRLEMQKQKMRILEMEMEKLLEKKKAIEKLKLEQKLQKKIEQRRKKSEKKENEEELQQEKEQEIESEKKDKEQLKQRGGPTSEIMGKEKKVLELLELKEEDSQESEKKDWSILEFKAETIRQMELDEEDLKLHPEESNTIKLVKDDLEKWKKKLSELESDDETPSDSILEAESEFQAESSEIKEEQEMKEILHKVRNNTLELEDDEDEDVEELENKIIEDFKALIQQEKEDLEVSNIVKGKVDKDLELSDLEGVKVKINEWDIMHSASTLLFLQNRENDCEIGSLVSGGNDGKIRLWSVRAGSGLLARFSARIKPMSGISSLATDSENRYLATGHSTGFLRLWLLEGYCNKDEQLSGNTIIESMKRFPFLRLQKEFVKRGIKEKQYNPQPGHPFLVITHAPLLLNSYRAHLDSISHVEFASSRELVITGCWDGSVRVWHLHGSFIGSFGQKNLWDLQQEISVTSSCLRNMPPDVRRTASPTTLKILNNGHCPRWEQALRVVRRCKRISGSSAPWEKECDKRKEYAERYQMIKERQPILGKFHNITEKPVPRPIISPLDDVNFKVAAYNVLKIPDIKIRPSVEVTSEMSKSLIRAGFVYKPKKNRTKGTDPSANPKPSIPKKNG